MTKKIIKLTTKDNTNIEVVQFGSKKPKILLIAGMHGDEKIGTQILLKLIKEIELLSVNGLVNIIKVANPKAYQASQRLHPKDQQDLNRHFPPLNHDMPTDNIASVLTEFALNHDLVIDLHSFPNQISPIVGVSLYEGSEDKQRESNRLLKCVQPDIIWLLNSKRTEPQKGGSICSMALNADILAFGLELPPDDLISQNQINKVLEGLKAVLAKFNVINYHSPMKTEDKIPVYERQIYKSLVNGLFIPQSEILTKVENSKIIGKIENQQTGQFEEIYSSDDGILLTISKRMIVKKEDKLYVLGKKIDSRAIKMF